MTELTIPCTVCVAFMKITPEALAMAETKHTKPCPYRCEGWNEWLKVKKTGGVND